MKTKETQRKKIRGKIFTKNDLSRIWKIFSGENSALENGSGTQLRILVRCSDEALYESDSDFLLQEGNIVDLKKTISLAFEYSDSAAERYLSLYLLHGHDDRSEYIVKGSDQYWVSGISKKIDELLDSITPQNIWLTKRGVWLDILAIAAMFITYWNLFSDLMPERTRLDGDIAAISMSILLSAIIGIVTGLGISYWIKSYWPNIEFDFGPEHTKLQKNRRKIFAAIIVLLAFPVLTNIFSNWISN